MKLDLNKEEEEQRKKNDNRRVVQFGGKGERKEEKKMKKKRQVIVILLLSAWLEYSLTAIFAKRKKKTGGRENDYSVISFPPCFPF